VDVKVSPSKALPGEARAEAEEAVLAEDAEAEVIATAVENAEAEGTCAAVLRMVAVKERHVCPASSFFGSLGAGMAHVARSSSWNRVLKTCQTSRSSFKKVV
jgi:hypothetical protein